MHVFTVILYLLAGSLSSKALAVRRAQHPLSDQESKYIPRSAREDDLDDFVTTFIAAFGPGPIWQYTHFQGPTWENYTWTCLRTNLQHEWENLSETTFVNVITVPRHKAQFGERNETAVSLAVWRRLIPEDFDRLSRHSTLPLLPLLHKKCSDKLDTNQTREDDLKEQFDRIAWPYIANSTTPQLYLSILATHPDWDGHGFGAAQVHVGMRQAAHAGMPVTLIATPAGYPLYVSLGFHSMANLTFVKLDHLGILWNEYMRWDRNG